MIIKSKEERLVEINDKIRRGESLVKWSDTTPRKSSLFYQEITYYREFFTKETHIEIVRDCIPTPDLLQIWDNGNVVYSEYGIIERLEYSAEMWYREYLIDKIKKENN